MLGGLYQGWLLHDDRRLCPAGWKIPSLQEFQILEEFAGGGDLAGAALKSHLFWLNVNGLNHLGFNAYPAGHRASSPSGLFGSVGEWAWFWTSSGVPQTPEDWDQWTFAFGDLNNHALPVNLNLSSGFSVRCIQTTDE